jgi:hypothetical protein
MGAFNGEPVCSVVRADESSPRGWHAPYYYNKEPAISADMQANGGTVVMWSLFSPVVSGIQATGNSLHITIDRIPVTIEIGLSSTDPIATVPP